MITTGDDLRVIKPDRSVGVDYIAYLVGEALDLQEVSRCARLLSGRFF